MYITKSPETISFLFCQDWVSLCGFGACPGTRSIDQAGLQLRDSPVSISRVLGLKMCATTAQPEMISICAEYVAHGCFPTFLTTYGSLAYLCFSPCLAV